MPAKHGFRHGLRTGGNGEFQSQRAAFHCHALTCSATEGPAFVGGQGKYQFGPSRSMRSDFPRQGEADAVDGVRP